MDPSIRPLRFGPAGRFELRPAEYQLLVDGQAAVVGGRALDLLIALAARPGQLLTKSELLDIVWPGLVVEENNLRVQVNALRRLLGEEAIATVPGRGYRLSAVLHAAPDVAAGPQPTLLPALRTPAPQRLFGRDADLGNLQSRLSAPGCVTLVGMPGVGKSSLARAAVARWTGRSAWVDLSPLSHGGQVAGAVARALGLPGEDGDLAAQLLRAMPQDPALLLVLDNAEHLVDACAGLAQQLSGAVALRLLVTSQVPLAVVNERVQRLEPLSVATAATANPAVAMPGLGDFGDGTIAMLVERITASDGRYQVTPAALPLLASVCQQLDGLPLALEMAAARVPLMGLRAVHDALAERFALLSRGRRDSPARHRTLHDALAWSYGLLPAPEQRLFRALALFAGGFTLDLAVTLTCDEHVNRWDTVDGLATLVERSLVSVSGEDPPRYRMLETMRAYALAQLAQLAQLASASAGSADELHSLHRRHAAALLSLFVAHPSDALCLAEMENTRVAFLWAQHNDLATAAQLSARVARMIGFSPWRQEVTGWMLSLEPAMRQAAGSALPLTTQAQWWSNLAYVLNMRRSRAATAAAKHCVALWRQLHQGGDQSDHQSGQQSSGHGSNLVDALVQWLRSIAEPGPELDEASVELQRNAATIDDIAPRVRLRVQGALAEAARVRGDYPALLACREQELRLAREQGVTDMAHAVESNLCAVLIELGRHAEAAQRGQALLAQIDAVSPQGNGNLPWLLNVIVEALVRQGHCDAAQALVPRSLATGQRFGTSVAWQGILGLVAAQRRWPAAARLLGYLTRLWSADGATPDSDEQAKLAQVGEWVERALGFEPTLALLAEGRLMDERAAAHMASLERD